MHYCGGGCGTLLIGQFAHCHNPLCLWQNPYYQAEVAYEMAVQQEIAEEIFEMEVAEEIIEDLGGW